MSPDPDRREQDLPYPASIDRRVSVLEGWRGSVDEQLRGIQSWRSTIEREGLVTAVAVIGAKMDQTRSEVSSAREEIREVKHELDDLKDDRNVRRGVTLTGKTIAAGLAALAAAGSIIGLLIALISGGGT